MFGVVPVDKKTSRFTIESVQASAVSPNPQCALGVFSDGCDFVVRKAVRVSGIVLVESKLPGSLIQPVQAIFVPYPKKPLAVRLYGPDHVVVQALRISSL